MGKSIHFSFPSHGPGTIIGAMTIHGIQKLTLVDYPGKTAAILFTGACNFRCPFCHNASLVLRPESQPVLDEGEIMEFLTKRRNMLEGVVVTGGEPTLQRDLIPFLLALKNLGYKVKLDTNGYRPDVLKSALEKNAVDYVAMDIKTSLDEYPILTGIADLDVSLIEESVAYLKGSTVEHEFRTTVVEPLHHRENFEKIGRLLEGDERFFLQSYVESGDTIGKNCFPPSSDTLQSYLEILRNYIGNVSIRDRG